MTEEEKKSGQEERIVSDVQIDEDVVFNLSLRPATLAEFVGQKKAVANLKIAIKAAKQRNEPLEHLLLSGPPGLGKTTLAHIISKEMGGKITSTSGPAIERPGDLIGILTNLENNDVFFIDEIHRLSKVVEEYLYPAMESFEIDFVIDKGPYAKTIKFNLNKFTFIGATTRAGLLTPPMRGRFGMFYYLDFYPPEDLIQIIKRSANLLNIELEEAAEEIALRSRGCPRVTNRLLRRVRDFAQVKADGKITKKVTQEALRLQQVDKKGLDELDRKVLRTIINYYNGGPVGIGAISATLNEDSDTIVDMVEPYLLKIGFLQRTSRGRKVTSLACEHLNIKEKSTNEKQNRIF